MSKKIKLSELRPGKKYKVTFHDCCVQGVLTGIFKGWEDEAEDDPPEDLIYHIAFFDFGVIEGWAWEVEVIDSRPQPMVK